MGLCHNLDKTEANSKNSIQSTEPTLKNNLSVQTKPTTDTILEISFTHVKLKQAPMTSRSSPEPNILPSQSLRKVNES